MPVSCTAPRREGYHERLHAHTSASRLYYVLDMLASNTQGKTQHPISVDRGKWTGIAVCVWKCAVCCRVFASRPLLHGHTHRERQRERESVCRGERKEKDNSPPQSPLNIPPRLRQPPPQLPRLARLAHFVVQTHEVFCAAQVGVVFVFGGGCRGRAVSGGGGGGFVRRRRGGGGGGVARRGRARRDQRESCGGGLGVLVYTV